MTELQLIHSILEPWGDAACVSCSFQAEDVALLHLVRQANPGIPVLFVDTGYHFPSLLRYRDELATAWRINLIRVASSIPRDVQELHAGQLYRSNPAVCCRLRKHEPLWGALKRYLVWFTGLRQEPNADDLGVFESVTLPSGHGLLRVNPLAHWTASDVAQYLRANEIPHAPLYDEGYGSIDCAPCTPPPSLVTISPCSPLISTVPCDEFQNAASAE